MVPPLAPPAKDLPVFRDLRFVNVTGTADSVGLIRGLADSPVRNVRFENVRVSARTGLTVQNARGLDLAGLTADVKEGPPVVMSRAP